MEEADGFYTAHVDEFIAEDYTALFSRIHSLASSDEYRNLRRGTAEMLREISRVKSITVGFNFDASLSPSEAGILSVNDYYIESGLLIDRLLRMDTHTEGQSIAPLVVPRRQCKEDEYRVLTYSMYAALNKIFRRQIKQWEPEITAYIGEHLAFLLEILPDLRFIAEIAGIQKTLQDAGLRLSPVEFFPKEERVLRGKAVYNPILALSLKERQAGDAVASDVCFDEGGSAFLLTGPNNGGKSEYLTALCLCTVMAQLGMMVPAESFSLSPTDAIFLHVPKVTALNERGRLAEECAYVSSVFRRAGPHSLLLFDEAFSSTDVTEAVELSVHVLRAILHHGARCVFSTHFHQLAHYTDELNSAPGIRGKIDFLAAGIDENEQRTYKILRRPPEGKSHAKSIADAYGISFEKLIAPGDNAPSEKDMNRGNPPR